MYTAAYTSIFDAAIGGSMISNILKSQLPKDMSKIDYY